MKEKYNKYWGPGKIPFLYGFGCILDLRIKFEGCRDFLQYLVDMIGENYILSDHARVVEGFYSLFRTYQTRIGPQPEPSPPRNQSTSTCMFQQLYQHARGAHRSPSPLPSSSRTSQDSASNEEIALYNTSRFVSMQQDTLDVLAWWMQRENMFPILSRIARDVLSIPVSTVSSEAAFSSSGRIIDDRRCSLAPEMVEALTVGKDWLLHDRRAQETFVNFDLVDDFDFDLSSLNIDD